jgi:hypothetical protein
MQKHVFIALFALPLVACVTTTDEQTHKVTTAPPPWISVIGTPFLIALKIPVCVATVAVAGPIAGVARLTPPDSQLNQYNITAHLDDGVIQNCGPPYVVSP